MGKEPTVTWRVSLALPAAVWLGVWSMRFIRTAVGSWGTSGMGIAWLSNTAADVSLNSARVVFGWLGRTGPEACILYFSEFLFLISLLYLLNSV